jgi:transcriptional regulator with XRE-family HTH domain
MKDKSLKKLGENLRFLRTKAGISQEELAENAGLHRNFVGMIERAEREVGIKKLIQIAQALKANPAEIFKGLL